MSLNMLIEFGDAFDYPPWSSVPNDEELTELARKGDIDAFSKLIQRHTGMCTRRALLIMHNLNDAEDVVQSAFRKAFQYREQFQANGAFAAWLGRIVENECLTRIREKRNALFVYLDNPTKANVRVELVSQAMNQEDELGREEVAKVLQEEMPRMPPLFRNIMLPHDREHLAM